jgi:hypothetical protein
LNFASIIFESDFYMFASDGVNGIINVDILDFMPFMFFKFCLKASDKGDV